MKTKLWSPFLIGVLASVINERGIANSLEILAIDSGNPILHVTDEDDNHLMISVVVNEVQENEVPKIHDPNVEP